MKALVKLTDVQRGLMKIGIEESLVKAILSDLSNLSDAATFKDKDWKKQFPDTLYVMEPLSSAKEEFPGYKDTEHGEHSDVFAVYELMGFVKVVERKTKETIDV